jgi:hypothetical protein
MDLSTAVFYLVAIITVGSALMVAFSATSSIPRFRCWGSRRRAYVFLAPIL